MAAKNPNLSEQIKSSSFTTSSNPYLLSNVGAPVQYNSATTPVTYNGFKWSFSAPVTWGRFISGEPYVILPPAGVMVTGVSYENTPGIFENCPVLKTGYTNQANQLAGIGITMWINGSMKNPKAWWHQTEFNWNIENIGYTLQNWIYDERLSYAASIAKGFFLNKGTGIEHHPMSDFLFFPVGLSGGDVLVTAKSSFNENYEQATYPQGENRWVSWTEPYMGRCVIEKYGILTTIPQNSGPTYADCYRPPVMWNGASFTNRPIFYRRDMVKNTEDYLLKMPEKNVYGETINLSDANIQQELNYWNQFVNNYWTSSIMPYHSAYGAQYALGAMDQYNTTTEFKKAYPGSAAKVRDQTLQCIFVPWVSRANRRKALDKVMQHSIDNWGLINAGGWAYGQGGGINMCLNTPWVSFLGWAYDRNDIKNWHTNQQLRNRLSAIVAQENGQTFAGISTGKWQIGQIQIPESYYIKSLVSQDYSQRIKVFGSSIQNVDGFTACIMTNPNINLYHGLTSPSKAIGATGIGWVYKTTGITCAYSYTLSSVKLSGEIISGSFGVVVAHKDFVARLNALGPSSGLLGPATLPPYVNSNGNLQRKVFDAASDVAEFWGFTNSSIKGSKLKITSGPGAGNTAYTILESRNIFLNRSELSVDEAEQQQTGAPGNISTIQYATFILDRDFDNNQAPTSQSTFMIYPAESDYSGWAFTPGQWYDGHTGQSKTTLPIVAQQNYNNIADESHIKHAAVMNWVGNTFEQPMVDYTKDVYWSTALPSYLRRQKALGSAYVGNIYDGSNILGGNVIVQMLGVTGATFFPRTINPNDLAGASDAIPAVPLDGITLEFVPEFIPSFSVGGGSGITYSGYGKVFTSPQTILNIKAIIDDKIFISQNQVGLYQLLGDLKIKFGPFMTDEIIVESVEENSRFKDRVAVYGFGAPRVNLNIVNTTIRTDYVRQIPSMQELATSNNQIAFTFYSNKYSLAGAAGILPNVGETARLTSSYGMKTLTRTDTNTFRAYMTDDVFNSTINISDLWYCVASPFVSGASAMADEYKYSNWKKANNTIGFFAGTNLAFDTSGVSAGGSTANYTTSTTGKLIFFKYMVNNDLASYPFREVEVPAPTGLTQSNWNYINSTNYAGWTSTNLYKIDKIDQLTTGNVPGNAGYFRLTFNNSTSNDYRRKSYNHFRLWYNNYFDFEGRGGIPAFYSRMENLAGNLDNTTHFYDKLALSDNFTENNIKYYSSNPSNIVFNSIIGSNYAHNGFFNTYLRGQTMTFVVPATPHTLLWCTGATN